MATRYLIGETVRAAFTFLDAADAAVTGEGIVATVRRPDGTTAALTTVEESGVVYADIPTTQAGQWRLRVTCTGPTAAAAETNFEVLPSRVI